MWETNSCKCQPKDVEKDGSLSMLGLKTLSDFHKEYLENNPPIELENI